MPAPSANTTIRPEIRAILSGAAATKAVCSGAVTAVSLELRRLQRAQAPTPSGFAGLWPDSGGRPRRRGERDATGPLHPAAAGRGLRLLRPRLHRRHLADPGGPPDRHRRRERAERLDLPRILRPRAPAGLRHRAASRGHGRGALRAQQALHRQRAHRDDGRGPRPGVDAPPGRALRRPHRPRHGHRPHRARPPLGRDPRRANPRDPLRSRQRAHRRAAVPAPPVRAHPLHHRHQPRRRDGGHLPQRPARPRAAGDLFRPARAPRARRDGGAPRDAGRRRAGARGRLAAHLGPLRPVRLRSLRPPRAGERPRAAALGIPGADAPVPHARDAGRRPLRPRRLRLRRPLQDRHAAPRHDLPDDRARHAPRRRLPAQRLRQAGRRRDRRSHSSCRS